MKTMILALSAAASLLGGAAIAQPVDPATAQAQADYQAKQAQYQDQQAQYQASQDQYHDQKRAYHRELERWAAGQPWPERYWGDRYVVTDWGVAHLRDPGEGNRWYRDDNGNYVRVGRDHVIEEVYTR
jgi:Ni/Co efflux regulator RcnB